VKKNVKNVKKRTYSFTGHLITPGFNTQLPKVSTCKSQTIKHLAQKCGHKKLCHLELCVMNAYIPITTMYFEAKISIDIFSANLTRLCNYVSVIIQPNF